MHLHGAGRPQVAHWLQQPADDAFYAAVPWAFLTWAAVATVLAYVKGRPGMLVVRGQDPEDEIF